MSGSEQEPFLFLSGATGHTGSRAARRLLGDGWRLRCLLNTGAHASRLPHHERLEIVHGDLRRHDDWLPRLLGASAFLHMAHVGFAEQVIHACERADVLRVVALSSTRRFTRFPERTSELVIAGEAAFAASRLDYTVLRSSMIYGGDRDNNIEKIVQWLKRRRWVPLVAGGKNRVQPIFVGDLVEAIARAIAHPVGARRRMLTVAGPEAMTARGMVEAVGAAMGRPPIFIPVPYGAIYAAAAVAQVLPGKKLATTAQIRRQLEEKVFDIREASDALGGWRPRPFNEGIKLKLEGKA